MQLSIGKKILPMVLVVVSKLGSCEPIIAKPNDKGSAVLNNKDVPCLYDRTMRHTHHRH